MTWILVLLAMALGAGLAFYYLRGRELPRSAPRPVPKAAPGPRYWGKQLRVPDPERACQAARALDGRAFALGKVPSLPLQGCSCAQCSCQYAPLAERRSREERRAMGERRDAIRFEDRKDRRCDHDRRSGDHYDWRFTP
jgi:hypothetical protein